MSAERCGELNRIQKVKKCGRGDLNPHARLKALGPQPSVSASSTTSANKTIICSIPFCVNTAGQKFWDASGAALAQLRYNYSRRGARCTWFDRDPSSLQFLRVYCGRQVTAAKCKPDSACYAEEKRCQKISRRTPLPEKCSTESSQ